MFEFDFGHGEELDLLRDTVRDFATDRIAPRAAAIDAGNEYPADLWPELGALGVLGITVEDCYGGSELGYLAHVIAMEEISRASASVGLSYGAHSNLCVNQLQRWGSKEQKQKYLPKLVSGEFLGALAMSEAGAGSDVMGMRTTARLDGDEYVLSGTKMWITNAPGADVMIVYAKTDPDADSHGVSAFLVERGTQGFSTPHKLDKLGMRGSDTSEVVLDNCRIPASNLLAEKGKGAAILMSGLDYE
jgi:isovaleryl-CoA dehydrogenase